MLDCQSLDEADDDDDDDNDDDADDDDHDDDDDDDDDDCDCDSDDDEWSLHVAYNIAEGVAAQNCIFIIQRCQEQGLKS